MNLSQLFFVKGMDENQNSGNYYDGVTPDIEPYVNLEHHK